MNSFIGQSIIPIIGESICPSVGASLGPYISLPIGPSFAKPISPSLTQAIDLFVFASDSPFTGPSVVLSVGLAIRLADQFIDSSFFENISNGKTVLSYEVWSFGPRRLS